MEVTCQAVLEIQQRWVRLPRKLHAKQHRILMQKQQAEEATEILHLAVTAWANNAL